MYSARMTVPSWITGAPPVACLYARKPLGGTGSGKEALQGFDLWWCKEIVRPPRVNFQFIRNLELFAEPNYSLGLGALEMVDNEHL